MSRKVWSYYRIETCIDLMFKEFYEVSKWNWETGKPKKEKLMELDLTEVAKDLWG